MVGGIFLNKGILLLVIRLLSGPLSTQGTSECARNLGWPAPHPFSLPQESQQAGRRWGIYKPDSCGSHPGVFRMLDLLISPDKAETKESVSLLLPTLHPLP